MGQFDLTYCLRADAEFMMGYIDCGDIKSTHFSLMQMRMSIGGAVFQRWRNLLGQKREILKMFHKNRVPYIILFFALHKIVSRGCPRLERFNMLKSV